MSLDEVQVRIVEPNTSVPYIQAPEAVSVSNEVGTPSISSVSGESLFRDLVAFVNPGSGGRQGPALVRHLSALIGTERVFTIGKVNNVLRQPIDYLAKAVSGRSQPLRVVVCGGDGTVAWVISDSDKLLQPHSGIQIFIIPLGTGNDLARAMYCGGGYAGRNVHDLRTVLQRCLSAEPVLLDRWQLNIELTSSNPISTESRQVFNYFSLGLDARIASRFHHARQSNPGLFFAQCVNKLWYGCFACRQFCDSLPPLHTYVDLRADGQVIELPSDLKGLMFLNIGSYAGGRRLWQQSELPPNHISDTLLEIVGVRSVAHLSCVTVCHIAALPLLQASSIELKFKPPASATSFLASFQIDGEPFTSPIDGRVFVQHTSKSTMLKCINPPSSCCF